MSYKSFISTAPSEVKGAINSHCTYLLDNFYGGDFNRILEQIKLDDELSSDFNNWDGNDWNYALDMFDTIAQMEFEKSNNL